VSLSGKEVVEIARLLDQSRFSQLSLEIGDFRLRIRRDGAADREEAEEQEAVRPAPMTAPVAKTATPGPGEVDVPAPFLGIFYHAARPGAAPFVAVGQEVAEDSMIGIIEVMKLMNGVRAGVKGKVIALLAPNAEAVEAGQPLLRVATR
jgi:acetyl-CoA carboxylase biotin carboxyl carrier protein